jgi:peptidoglycan hydrolase-like protein with peptidoglycan-binding domain
MRRPSGVVLVLAGLGVAAYALAGPETPPDAPPNGPEAKTVITIAESRPSSSLQTGMLSAVATEARQVADSIGKASLPAPPPRAAKKSETARGVVIVKGAVRTPVGQPMAGNGPPLDRASLTRDLQRQLQRVGCYRGSISGVWSPSTRQAMKEFIDHVNATLPVSEPDHILLAMLQSHDDKACGQGAIVAREPARQRPETRALTAHQAPTPRDAHGNGPATAAVESAMDPRQPAAPQPMPGRMSLAGPEAGTPPSPTDTQAVRPKTDHGKEASRARARKAGSTRNVTNGRRRMGAWIFHDAPVDRLLAR